MEFRVRVRVGVCDPCCLQWCLCLWLCVWLGYGYSSGHTYDGSGRMDAVLTTVIDKAMRKVMARAKIRLGRVGLG